jgi:diacylglycerol kinase family enzyme
LVSEPEPDGLDAFGSEDEPQARFSPVSTDSGVPKESSRSRHDFSLVKWLLLMLAIAGVAAAGTWQYQRRVAAPQPGSLTIQTTTPGLEVVVAGAVMGRTPLTVSLTPGSYKVQVRSGLQKRDIDVSLAAGATVQHFLDIAPATPGITSATLGSLQVQTDVPAMSVVVDGVDRGQSPLTITDLAPGEHQVVVRADGRTIRRIVSIQAGETFSLVLSSLGSPTTSPGWLAITAPVVMQIREDGQLIGTTEAEKLMIAAGDHDIEIVNEALGFSTSRRITVAPGKVATARVELPQGTLSINALPWAEVWLDGERIGETPIANLNVRLGQREVLFRHPQLGERRESVNVTLKAPARLGIDLRRQ